MIHFAQQPVKHHIYIKNSLITFTVTFLTCHHQNQTVRTVLGMRIRWGHTLAGASKCEVFRGEVVVNTVWRQLLFSHQGCHSFTPEVKWNTRTLKINFISLSPSNQNLGFITSSATSRYHKLCTHHFRSWLTQVRSCSKRTYWLHGWWWMQPILNCLCGT